MQFDNYYDALDLYRRRLTFEILVALERRPSRRADLPWAAQPYELDDTVRRMAHDELIVCPVRDEDPYTLTPKGRLVLGPLRAFLTRLHQWALTCGDDASAE